MFVSVQPAGVRVPLPTSFAARHSAAGTIGQRRQEQRASSRGVTSRGRAPPPGPRCRVSVWAVADCFGFRSSAPEQIACPCPFPSVRFPGSWRIAVTHSRTHS